MKHTIDFSVTLHRNCINHQKHKQNIICLKGNKLRLSYFRIWLTKLKVCSVTELPVKGCLKGTNYLVSSCAERSWNKQQQQIFGFVYKCYAYKNGVLIIMKKCKKFIMWMNLERFTHPLCRLFISVKKYINILITKMMHERSQFSLLLHFGHKKDHIWYFDITAYYLYFFCTLFCLFSAFTPLIY